MMHKLSGMRDPMLNLMMNDPALFDELLEEQPSEKKKQYEKLRKNKSAIKAYHQRLKDTYGDSTSHAAMDRGKDIIVVITSVFVAVLNQVLQ